MATAEYSSKGLIEFGVLAIVAGLQAPATRQVDLNLITPDFALRLQQDGLNPQGPMVVRLVELRVGHVFDAYVFEQ